MNPKDFSGRASCGCIHHAEEGVPCIHDLELYQKAILTMLFFKFQLNQVIFFMHENKVVSAPVISRLMVDNHKEDSAFTDVQKQTWNSFGPQRIVYATVHHGEVPQDRAFASKEELLKSL